MYKIATQKYKIIDAHCTTQNIKIVNGKISIRNISNIFSNIKDDYYRQIVYHYFFKKIINTIESQTINIIYEGPEFDNINNILNTFHIAELYFGFKIKIENIFYYFTFEINYSSKLRCENCKMEICGPKLCKYQNQEIPESLKTFFKTSKYYDNDKKQLLLIKTVEGYYYEKIPNFDFEYLDNVAHELGLWYAQRLKEYNATI